MPLYAWSPGPSAVAGSPLWLQQMLDSPTTSFLHRGFLATRPLLGSLSPKGGSDSLRWLILGLLAIFWGEELFHHLGCL